MEKVILIQPISIGKKFWIRSIVVLVGENLGRFALKMKILHYDYNIPYQLETWNALKNRLMKLVRVISIEDLVENITKNVLRYVYYN